jgi:hypothetical protein
MMRDRLFLSLFALGLLASSTAQAERDEPLDDRYAVVKLMLGFNGRVAIDPHAPPPASDSYDLSTSFGVAAEYNVPLHDFFSIGALLGVTSWRSSPGSDASASRNLDFDLALVPRGRFVVSPALELYVAVPIGLALDFLNELNLSNSLSLPVLGTNAGISIDGGSALGFMIAAMVGARVALASGFGLIAELGYVHHAFTHSVTTNFDLAGLASTSVKTNLALSLGELALNIGVFF